jgi:ATP-dependent Lhr-like helicase
LRREIEPVSTARYERFLEQWQHLAAGSQLHGVDGTLQVIKQLQGMEFPASAWESEIFPKRLAHYDSKWLDELCASGEVMWGRLTPHPAFEPSEQPRSRRVRPTRVAPISLFLRQDADWLIARQHKASGRTQATERGALSGPARDVLGAIEQHGASFFVDLVRTTGRLASEVEDGLWELVAAGLVTADGFDNLRALIDPKRRLALGRHNLTRPRHAIGRWALLKVAGAPHSANAHDAELEAFAHQLLARWGIVFRDVVQRESFAPPWRDLLVTLRRLEMQGVVRGGRFVASSIGEQFCRPDALEALRAMREPTTTVDQRIDRPA